MLGSDSAEPAHSGVGPPRTEEIAEQRAADFARAQVSAADLRNDMNEGTNSNMKKTTVQFNTVDNAIGDQN